MPREYAREGIDDYPFPIVADMMRRRIALPDVTINTLMQAAVGSGRFDVAHPILQRTVTEIVFETKTILLYHFDFWISCRKPSSYSLALQLYLEMEKREERVD